MPMYEDGEREEGVMASCLSENAVGVDSLSNVYLLNTSYCQPKECTKQGLLHLPREFRDQLYKELLCCNRYYQQMHFFCKQHRPRPHTLDIWGQREALRGSEGDAIRE